MINWFFIFIFFAFPVKAAEFVKGGIVLSFNQAMTALPFPDFTDTNKAVMWAHEHKYDPQAIRMLQIMMTNFQSMAFINNQSSHPDAGKAFTRAINQSKNAQMAVEIMQSYKGDSAMSFKIDDEESCKKAAHDAKYNEDALQSLQEYQFKLIRSIIHDLKLPRNEGLSSALTSFKHLKNVIIMMTIMETYKDKAMAYKKKNPPIEIPKSKYILPYFDSVADAHAWALKTKWVEPLRQLLSYIVNEMELQITLAHKLEELHVEDTEKMIALVDERLDRYKEALDVMEDFKKRGIKGNGDAAMNGCSVYAGAIPIIKE